MRLFCALLVLICCINACFAFYSGPFVDSLTWVSDPKYPIERSRKITFTVALKMNHVDEMKQEFLDVSMPDSPKYGQHLTLDQIHKKYSLSQSERNLVASYFETIPGAVVTGRNHKGDMLTVTASIHAIESRLGTSLSYKRHSQGLSKHRALRADSDLHIPVDVQELISFVSLNSPVTHVLPKAGTSLKDQQHRNQRGSSADPAWTASSSEQVIGASSGNDEALISFVPICGDGSRNQANPPCSNLPNPEQNVPVFTVAVTAHNNNISNPFLLNTNAQVFSLAQNDIYCYNYFTESACDGFAGNNCTCLTKLAPLPKYQQLQANVTYLVGSTPGVHVLGASSYFALTDVATASFLAELYNLPLGLTVSHGSNQSVVEFYKEFYSNSDLLQFFALSGLPSAIIPDANVLGDLANNQNNPGGEAQLDVEYIMALAPGANTFFYSFSDLNPNDPDNEGFLAYLNYVSQEANPPLVQSLSYGDVEATVFMKNLSAPVQNYGERCDQEFLKLGLRGISVIFSSGDDGIGNFIIRDDPATACAQAYPAWPASSPYVTSVGATQLTDKYLPACGKPYTNSAYGKIPGIDQLLFQCTGAKETVCSSTIGGVITSGGGFSNVNDRATTAPWQVAAVNAYLQQPGAVPPPGYFNASGRAYPDVATYGSNYFVYLDGKITRESGTSASAPVFAAMVTLWNDMRFAYNKPAMGFIAPFLYSVYAKNPNAFNDITTGDNACGAGHSLSDVNCCPSFFSAAPGWDAVTGLGSPNFGVISNLVLNQNIPFPSISASSSLSSEASSSGDSTDQSTTDTAIAGVVIGAIALVLGLGLLVRMLLAPKASSGSQALLK